MSDNQSALQSLVSFCNSQGEAARGTLLKLDRSAVVFEVYNPYSIVQLSEVLQDLVIRRGERVIYHGRAVVSNLVNTGLMLIVSAALVDQTNELNGLSVLRDEALIDEETVRFIAGWKQARKIRPGYQIIVSDVRSFFSELSRWLEPLDIGDGEGGDGSGGGQDAFIQRLLGPIAAEATELFARFEEEAAKVERAELFIHKGYAQRDLHPLIMRAPFPFRAYHKPFGYAGDYEMVNMMLRDHPEGPTTYAKIINILHLRAGVAEAHRNRIDILKAFLQKNLAQWEGMGREVRILNVGCGPAREIGELIGGGGARLERCSFRLIDFDEHALQFAEQSIDDRLSVSGRGPAFRFVKQSVHELLKMAAGRKDRGEAECYEVVYCAGLFDYLSDRVCNRLLRLFFQWTVPGGRLLVTNVHPSNPNRYSMEHVLEWYLIYRDQQELARLAPGLGRQQTFADRTGVNVFLEIEKPVRLDG